MDFRSKTTSEKKKKKQQEDPTISRSVASPYRHSVSSSPGHTSSPFASYITRSFTKTATSPLKRTSYSSPRRSFCTETSCQKPSPRRGASAWALSPGRSLDMIETAVPQRKSVDLGRVGSGMGGVMGLFARRKKVDPAEEETVHRLRIILAQLVQWRFVNARADAAMNCQQFVSERKLFYAWLRLAEMRNVVTAKRVLLQRGMLKLKLQSMLIVQVKLLMQWEQVARPHVDAVAVLGKVLGVTCLSLPLVQGAQANIVSLHRCLRVSMDIMKDIEAKTKIFYSMAETISLMFVELTKTILLEMEGLQQLTNLCQKITLLQMKEASLRANLIQATKSEDEKLALSKPLALHRHLLQSLLSDATANHWIVKHSLNCNEKIKPNRNQANGAHNIVSLWKMMNIIVFIDYNNADSNYNQLVLFIHILCTSRYAFLITLYSLIMAIYQAVPNYSLLAKYYD